MNEMELNIRTWNLNFWKKRFGKKEKTSEEIDGWTNYCRNIIKNDKNINIYLFQEASRNLYDNNIDDNGIYYLEIPGKISPWGLIVHSQIGRAQNSIISNAKLGYMCCSFKSIDNKTVTIINIHAQPDYSLPKEICKKNYGTTYNYHITLQNIINEIRPITKEDGLIILAGDFNASSEFHSTEIDEFKIIFEEIKNMGFVDCLREKYPNFYDRSTMVNYKYQNDYVFINENKKEWDIRICKEIESDYIDHYPIDFMIRL
jgi:hypothetical protein